MIHQFKDFRSSVGSYSVRPCVMEKFGHNRIQVPWLITGGGTQLTWMGYNKFYKFLFPFSILVLVPLFLFPFSYFTDLVNMLSHEFMDCYRDSIF